MLDQSDELLDQFAAMAPGAAASEAYQEKLREAQVMAPGTKAVDLQRPEKVRYTHDAMIDLIIRNPAISQNEIAAIFGYSPPSISRIVGADGFQARLHERKKELVDPGILASIEERFNILAQTSLGILQEKLESGRSVDLALKGLEVAAKALGYGARQPTVAVNNSFVVNLPDKASSQDAWVAKYGRGAIVEAAPLVTEIPK